MHFDEWLDTQIEGAQPEWQWWLLWDRQPLEIQTVKYDWPDDRTLRYRRKRQEQIRRELDFIVYDCT